MSSTLEEDFIVVEESCDMVVQADLSTLVLEYETILSESSSIKDCEIESQRPALLAGLMTTGEWSEQAATTLVALAEEYGAFVLRNAAALAIALRIDDGNCGL